MAYIFQPGVTLTLTGPASILCSGNGTTKSVFPDNWGAFNVIISSGSPKGWVVSYGGVNGPITDRAGNTYAGNNWPVTTLDTTVSLSITPPLNLYDNAYYSSIVLPDAPTVELPGGLTGTNVSVDYRDYASNPALPQILWSKINPLSFSNSGIISMASDGGVMLARAQFQGGFDPAIELVYGPVQRITSYINGVLLLPASYINYTNGGGVPTPVGTPPQTTQAGTTADPLPPAPNGSQVWSPVGNGTRNPAPFTGADPCSNRIWTPPAPCTTVWN